MSDRIVMVTGASAGMGKQISQELAQRGASVVMVCRDRERGEAALAEVKRLSGSEAVELMVADLSSRQAIRSLVREFDGGHDRLHVLINNVGVTLPKRLETVDGIEMVLATNHLAPFMLTNLLLPLLKSGAPARVITVSSGVQSMAKLDLDDLQSTRSYNQIRAYNQSKLLNLMFAYELARRLEGTGVTSNAVEPGFVRTNMKIPFPFSLFGFMRGSVEKGAWPAIHAATSPELEGVSGKFFNSRGVEIKSIAISYDERAAQRLWTISEGLTGLPVEVEPSPRT